MSGFSDDPLLGATGADEDEHFHGFDEVVRCDCHPACDCENECAEPEPCICAGECGCLCGCA